MEDLRKKIISVGCVKILKNGDDIQVINDSSKDGFVFFRKVVFSKDMYTCNVDFEISDYSGLSPRFVLYSRKGRTLISFDANTNNYFIKPAKFYGFAIKVFANSRFNLKTCKYDVVENTEYVGENFKNDILLLCPGYPSESNKYLFGFVHTRVREYIKNGMKLDVAYVNDNSSFTSYEYEGVKVNKISYFDIRNLLQIKKYKKILVHFFNDKFSQLLDATDISQTEVYLFFHGTDALYRDFNKLTLPYFTPMVDYTSQQLMDFKEKDKVLNRYNNMSNVKMIFGTEWIKNRSEEQNNIKYNNYEIIPTYINEKIFKYQKKNSDLRKKICIIRKYDNVSTYSIDLDVLTILELSRRDCFKDLEFEIYGDGYYHEQLLKPIVEFENVHIYRKFLSHNEIAEVHKNNGIALFGTRYETMGVSAAEAALSGLAVVTNGVAAVSEVFEDSPLLCDDEDYVMMADKIEEMYNNPKLFEKYRQQQHDCIERKYTYDGTLAKEIEMMSKNLPMPKYTFNDIFDKPVLSIGVASYNVQKYLRNSIHSLLNSKYANKLEILIINDGSKDDTAIIGRELQEISTVGNKSIVKFVDKENGGHGSAINKSIELATGKYFKLMDGDDYFDLDSLNSLIEILEKEDSDIILNNYVEDKSVECIKNPIRHYEFMKPGHQYNIEDLCNDWYGFGEWGPLLSTSTFKTEMLKKADFKISEKCFYVDMELNSFAFVAAKTVVYYPLDIYIYYLGRVGQSVSAASFKRNYKNHEHVTLRIIEDIYYGREMSNIKKKYLKDKIILPLINGQYYIVTEYFNNSKPFKDFDSQLKKFPEFYNDSRAIERKLKKYRILNGSLFYLIKRIVGVKSFIRSLIKR